LSTIPVLRIAPSIWSALTNPSISLTNVDKDGCYIDLKLYQPPISTKFNMPARNIVPFTKIEKMARTQGQINYSAYVPGSNPLLQPVNSDTEQLTKIPNYLMIACRKQWSNVGVSDSRSFLPVHNVSITFNGQSSILNTFTVKQLWEASAKNGLNASFEEYFGYTWQGGALVATCGAPLVLKFGTDIPLTGFNAAGSIGSFNIQVNANVLNNTGAAINSGAYELVVAYVYEGMLINELGTTTQVLGLLNASDVERASEKDIDVKSHSLYYGGGFWDDFKKYARKTASIAKQGLNLATKFSSDPRLQQASKGMNQAGDLLGFGRFGGANPQKRLSSRIREY
jgi:hypothetical protein